MDKNYLNKMLVQAQKFEASDIHLSTNLFPYIRTQGDIKILDGFKELSGKDILDITLSSMDKCAQEFFVKNLQVDYAYSNLENKTRYRVNVFKTHKGISAVFRQLNSKIPFLEDAGFPEIFNKIASLEKGLVLVCGPTGSGKSTTLATMIDFINRNFEKHIITLEDPIEYTYDTKKSLIEQREVGRSVRSFADGLRGALREDPDVIMIGEMRDKETIKMALTAAETGHLVFSTLHTMSASKTIDRIIDSCDLSEKEVVRSMLSTSLQAIILQTLFKKPDNVGRIAGFEILIATGGIRNMIRENKVYQIDSMIQTGSKYGMITMSEYTEKLIQAGLIDKKDVFAKLTKVDNAKE
ncbi:MAG: type IV pilus twitching motility protein PilT [Rickettsiales bacterium]|nr:type IV pilus twitching motility protein PilT [Rickettsiales bacterium]